MRHAQFKPLREAIQREGFTRHQLRYLLGDVVQRVCHLKEPELEAVQHDLSEACESLDMALAEVEEREARVEAA